LSGGGGGSWKPVRIGPPAFLLRIIFAGEISKWRTGVWFGLSAARMFSNVFIYPTTSRSGKRFEQFLQALLQAFARNIVQNEIIVSPLDKTIQHTRDQRMFSEIKGVLTRS